MNNWQVFQIRMFWDITDKLFHLKNSQVKGLNYIPMKNAIKLGKDNKLHLCFNCKYNNELDRDLFRVLPEIELLNGADRFVIPYGYAVFDGNLKVSFNKELKFDIKINRIDHGDIDEKNDYYWRYIYPIKFNRWFLQIESSNYVDDNGTQVGLSYLKTTLGNSDMHVFLTKREETCYFVIQSGSMIDSEEMYKRVFAIKTAIGLVTGNIFGDYHFQISSNDKNFDSIKSLIFGTLEDTKYCCYRIVNNKWVDAFDMLGRFEYQRYAQKILEESGYDPKSYYDNKPVGAGVINNLMNLLYSKNDLAISASMLLEGSLLNIIYQPSLFIVALETITSALMSSSQVKNLPPVENNEYHKIVEPALLKALNLLELPVDAKRIFTNRIKSSLNSSANRDKLTKSFEYYGYILSNEDKEAIKQRDCTLHGHLSDIKKELADQRWDTFATALRLHKLCCILLLKAAGYTGRIWNNEVIFGVEKACKREEMPYFSI